MTAKLAVPIVSVTAERYMSMQGVHPTFVRVLLLRGRMQVCHGYFVV